MAKFAFLLPRADMVEPAGRIAAELDMEVVVNKWVMDSGLTVAEGVEAKRLGADILVARGRQASLLKESLNLPVVEIKFTGQEVALLLYRARQMVPHIHHPRLGVVTIPNMLGDIHCFDEVLDIEVRTYFVSSSAEMESAAERAVEDNMDVILGGDFVNEYCRRRGRLTYPWDGTEDSIRNSLINAKSVGAAADAERKNTAHFQALLDYSFNGIIELSAEGVITQTNDIACKILGRSRAELTGSVLSELLEEEDREMLRETFRSGKEMYFSILDVGGVSVVANAARVTVGNQAEGVVFSFYEMRSMERQGARALRERYRLHRYLAHGRFGDVSHSSQTMRRVVRTAQTFAETTQPILLQGEVGNGKSLFAQSIHNASPCAGGPFVTFFCLSGEPGQNRALSTAIREADHGTLYLDGVDQLEAAGQLVLRRLLEERVAQGEVGEVPVPVNARVIASLDGQLYRAVEAGRFRSDLYYILAPMLVELPPLRTRPDDLSQAIDMCLDDCVTRVNRYVVLTKEARKALLDYRWPGNYTQLRAFLERMVLTAPSRTVNDSYVCALLEQLYPGTLKAQGDEEQKERPAESRMLADVLERHGGNRADAAAELGISKTTLWRRMKRYGVTGRYE